MHLRPPYLFSARSQIRFCLVTEWASVAGCRRDAGVDQKCAQSVLGTMRLAFPGPAEGHAGGLPFSFDEISR
jgi:hypothetical protein